MLSKYQAPRATETIDAHMRSEAMKVYGLAFMVYGVRYSPKLFLMWISPGSCTGPEHVGIGGSG